MYSLSLSLHVSLPPPPRIRIFPFNWAANQFFPNFGLAQVIYEPDKLLVDNHSIRYILKAIVYNQFTKHVIDMIREQERARI